MNAPTTPAASAVPKLLPLPAESAGRLETAVGGDFAVLPPADELAADPPVPVPDRLVALVALDEEAGPAGLLAPEGVLDATPVGLPDALPDGAVAVPGFMAPEAGPVPVDAAFDASPVALDPGVPSPAALPVALGDADAAAALPGTLPPAAEVPAEGLGDVDPADAPVGVAPTSGAVPRAAAGTGADAAIAAAGFPVSLADASFGLTVSAGFDAAVPGASFAPRVVPLSL